MKPIMSTDKTPVVMYNTSTVSDTNYNEWVRNFIGTRRALHDSLFIRFNAHGAMHARSQSILDRNVSFCAQLYHRSVRDVICNPVHSFINAFAINSVDYETRSASNLLTDSLMLIDLVFCFSNGVLLSHGKLNDVI